MKGIDHTKRMNSNQNELSNKIHDLFSQDSIRIYEQFFEPDFQAFRKAKFLDNLNELCDNITTYYATKVSYSIETETDPENMLINLFIYVEHESEKIKILLDGDNKMHYLNAPDDFITYFIHNGFEEQFINLQNELWRLDSIMLDKDTQNVREKCSMMLTLTRGMPIYLSLVNEYDTHLYDKIQEYKDNVDQELHSIVEEPISVSNL